MSEPSTPPSSGPVQPPAGGEPLAEKIKREQFEELINDPVKLAAAQDRLAREAVAQMRKNAPQEETESGLPVGRMVVSTAVCIGIYVGLWTAGQQENWNEMVKYGLAAFTLFFIVLAFVVGGMLVGRGTKLPVVYAAINGFVTGIALIATQAAMHVPVSKGQIFWVFAATAFYALGSLTNLIGKAR